MGFEAAKNTFTNRLKDLTFARSTIKQEDIPFYYRGIFTKDPTPEDASAALIEFYFNYFFFNHQEHISVFQTATLIIKEIEDRSLISREKALSEFSIMYPQFYKLFITTVETAQIFAVREMDIFLRDLELQEPKENNIWQAYQRGRPPNKERY